MAKTKTTSALANGSAKNSLVAASEHFDPSLAALFASSFGPITVPPKSIQARQATKASSTKPVQPVPQAAAEDETSSEVDSENAEPEIQVEDAENAERTDRPRKRRKLDVNEDLESQYMNRLLRQAEEEHKQRRKENVSEALHESKDDDNKSDLDSDLQDISESEVEDSDADIDTDGLSKHESLTSTDRDIEAEKQGRTAFLGNVAISAIKSKSTKKTLIAHLQNALDTKLGEKIESIRFRSTAFVSDAGPKRAAYAKKELMEETMRSTNAYVVLSSDAAVRKLVLKLNGSIVLDRHLRVDNLAQPSKTDHKRCVFVGNLSFVDEATSTDQTGEGEKARKRAKEPADVEEGLWRTFGKVGKVESVRVVRDKETRVSKGFAYVQFENEDSVEAALLMNEKKFPPLLPRILRVMRAKKEVRSMKRELPRDKHGRSRRDSRGQKRVRGSEAQNVVFEGHRATNNSADKSKAKKRSTVKPNNRSSKRAAAFKASGGKKKRDAK